MNKIANVIKTERLNREMTQKELAGLLGVTQDSISLWEKGKRIPDTNYVVELSRIFGISTDYLLGLEDDFGERTAALSVDTYSAEEKQVIQDYRKLTRGMREILRTTLKAMINDTSEDKI